MAKAEEITTGQVRAALENHFRIMFMNPSWDTIGDIIGDLAGDEYEPGTYPWSELEDYAYGLWGRARVEFKEDS